MILTVIGSAIDAPRVTTGKWGQNAKSNAIHAKPARQLIRKAQLMPERILVHDA
jgi:hypothetical protein